MKENENPQKNRPALARKRAKFSLKPDISQPSTNLEPVFQFDQLQDPEEFFAAYEKFVNTVKELKRQRGEDLNESIIPTTARQRRPEIPRQSQSDTSFSQETLQDTFEIPTVHSSQQESATPNCQSKEKEVAGSISKAEDKVNKLFDDLMSSNIANLDENEAMSYLKDQLKIKPVDINNLQLPNFHNIPKIDLISSVKNLKKDQSILPDTCAFSDSLKERTLGKQKKLPDKPFNPSSSPTPPRRPFVATFTFGELLPESIETESNVPFSAHDIDSFPTTTTSEISSWHSTHAGKDTGFPVSASKGEEFPVSASKHSISEPPITMEDLEQGHDMEEMDVVTVTRNNEVIQGNAEDMVQKAASPTNLNSIVEDITANSDLHSVQNVEENV
ncbi:hypothetical protein L1987_47902 [Smallanthus sonchifolius]|uniref:Uncharacterized protein n=1 Tax=Smallanthus sonchifolius TaxID=185202 RepID=A0ACB9FRC9_9ASTR|nr:hypothetical protein L1987_47902 [Smallanthus sonchifolius]